VADTDRLDATGYAAAMARLGAAVSRETVDRLTRYIEVLERWQRRINLVGASTLADPWRRHMLDSAQLVPLLPAGARSLVDLGSGAGFPGLVLAVHRVDLAVRLVEADARKSAFLQEAARSLGLTNVSVSIGRIERLAATPHDVVTSRALAPLEQLCAWAAPWLAPAGICLFHKGARHLDELTEARNGWMIDADVVASVADGSGVILRVTRLQRP